MRHQCLQCQNSLITFLATAANITLLGIGGAFWGFVAGMLTHIVMNLRMQRTSKNYKEKFNDNEEMKDVSNM